MKLRIKRMFSMVTITILFVLCLEGLQYLLIDDTSAYTRITLHELYNSEDNIDILFVGSSHVYRSLVPEIADDIFNKYTFNAGTSSQGMDGSLAIIKEAMAYHDVEQIYLEVYYRIAEYENYKERTEMTSTYIIADYMRPSLRKVQYLLEASSKDCYVNSFIPARRKWEKIFDFEYISELLARKSTENYKNYKWTNSNGSKEWYVDRGYVTSEKSFVDSGYWNDSAYTPIDIQNMSEDWRSSLEEIVTLCKEEGIKLTLFAAPMPDITLIGKENYDEYSMLIDKLADEYGIDYYDFNLCRSECFDAGNRAYFQDAGHLNGKGAVKFTEIFSKFMVGDISESNLFFDSYEEKISNIPPKVYGIGGPQTDHEEGVRYAKILSNRNDGIEYRVILTGDDGTEQVIKDFSVDKMFKVPIDAAGCLKIEARCVGETEIFQEIVVKY